MANVKVSTKQKQFLQSKEKVVLYLAGIGSGKSFIASEKACQQLALGAHTIVMAQSYKTLKLVMFAEILQRLRDHGIEHTYYKADMVIEVESTGGKIMGFSMDSVENMRGVTVDNAILDEAALYSKYAYEVLCGRLRRGKFPYQVWVTTTPRGKNWVYDLSKRPSTHFIHATTKDNPFLPQEYLDQIYAEYSGEFAEQELSATFLDANADAQLISVQELKAAMGRTAIINEKNQIIAGFDVARYGKDTSYLIIRRGDEILFRRRWSQMNTEVLMDEVIIELIKITPEVIVVDAAGLGGGMVDTFRKKLGTLCAMLEFNGANSASQPLKFANLRAQSWFRFQEWLATGCLPNDPDFSEATEIEYYIDSKNRKALISKEVLRTRGVPSPDCIDAIAMTLIDIRALSNKNKNKLKEALASKGRGFRG